VFALRARKEQTYRETDRQTDKTRNAAYQDVHIKIIKRKHRWCQDAASLINYLSSPRALNGSIADSLRPVRRCGILRWRLCLFTGTLILHVLLPYLIDLFICHVTAVCISSLHRLGNGFSCKRNLLLRKYQQCRFGIRQRRRGFKQLTEAESYNFPTDGPTANFRQRRLWVLKISILHLNLPNGGFPTQNFVSLEENFPTIRKFSDRLKFRGERNCPPPWHDAIAIHWQREKDRPWKKLTTKHTGATVQQHTTQI